MIFYNGGMRKTILDKLTRVDVVKPDKNRLKTAKQMERHLKGVANHRRIDILLLIAQGKGITVEGISGALKCNFKTASGHTSKLVQAGLVNKNYAGRSVTHSLSPYGKVFVNFLKSFQRFHS
jgi:predicted transcriptional regulator